MMDINVGTLQWAKVPNLERLAGARVPLPVALSPPAGPCGGNGDRERQEARGCGGTESDGQGTGNEGGSGDRGAAR